MDLLRDEEPDSLASLEDRILRAVELVNRLREERDGAVQQLEAALADKDAAVAEAREAREQAARVSEELEGLRSERKQVRTRIEKLLGQMDLLSSS